MEYLRNKLIRPSDAGITAGKPVIMPELTKEEKTKAIKAAKRMLNDFQIYGRKRADINERLYVCKTQEQINNVVNRAIMQYV